MGLDYVETTFAFLTIVIIIKTCRAKVFTPLPPPKEIEKINKRDMTLEHSLNNSHANVLSIERSCGIFDLARICPQQKRNKR